MRYVDEYRDPALAERLAARIAGAVSRPWVIMEVCGGQTHSIVRYGIDRLLPPSVELVHGPGCPVCVTSLETIDRAHAIASTPGVIFTSFGDMLRVPGSRGDLLTLRSRGADVRVVYSPLDALRIARENPSRRGVFCAVMGYREYESLAARYRVPIVVTGFEPLDLLEGIWLALRQLEDGRAEVENAYGRVVARDGNRPARDLVFEVFEVADRGWRGVGSIPKSGLKLAYEYRAHDAARLFEVDDIVTRESPLCISGQILRGLRKPCDCPAFGRQCTPQTPLGATMVSSEGACAAYYQYGRYTEGEAARSGAPGTP